jgi:twitching motility protein PilT
VARLDEMLALMKEQGASDLHLTSGFPPYLRRDGEMCPIEDLPILSPDACREVLYEIMPGDVREEFERTMDVDFGYEVGEIDRFRVNVFTDMNGTGAVIRRIPRDVPSADDLGLPESIRNLCKLSKGLVVVTGPTGSGKSTTLAAMVDLINRTRRDHIITIEDPIEFVHGPHKCLINQREVHTHTGSFSAALRAALREDPDIVLVGEMRDRETVAIALETAETGHLVFGTLHTNTAIGTVSRIVDKFPAEEQNQVRSLLADCLRGVVAQVLCRKITGGRVAAQEILVSTPGVASNIRDGKYHYITSAMQTGRSRGMQTMCDALLDLVNEGVISTEEAYHRAVEKALLAKKLRAGGFYVDAPLATDGPSPAESGVTGNGQTGRGPDCGMIRQYRASLQQDADRIDVLNNLAWVLATHPDPGLRDGREAVKLAARAYSLLEGQGKHSSSVLDTLAAAYAETGRFDKALQAAGRSLEIARAEGAPELVAQVEAQIKAYEAGQPCRDEGAAHKLPAMPAEPTEPEEMVSDTQKAIMRLGQAFKRRACA